METAHATVLKMLFALPDLECTGAEMRIRAHFALI